MRGSGKRESVRRKRDEGSGRRERVRRERG